MRKFADAAALELADEHGCTVREIWGGSVRRTALAARAGLIRRVAGRFPHAGHKELSDRLGFDRKTIWKYLRDGVRPQPAPVTEAPSLTWEDLGRRWCLG